MMMVLMATVTIMMMMTIATLTTKIYRVLTIC